MPADKDPMQRGSSGKVFPFRIQCFHCEIIDQGGTRPGDRHERQDALCTFRQWAVCQGRATPKPAICHLSPFSCKGFSQFFSAHEFLRRAGATQRWRKRARWLPKKKTSPDSRCWQARAMSNRRCLKLKWLCYGEQTKSTSQSASVLCVGVKAANTQLLATTAFRPALPVHLPNFSRRCTRIHCPGRRVERAQAADCLWAVLTTDPGTDLLYLPALIHSKSFAKIPFCWASWQCLAIAAGILVGIFWTPH